MKSDITDPWSGTDVPQIGNNKCENFFEDSFVVNQSQQIRLADSEEYLEKLCKF